MTSPHGKEGIMGFKVKGAPNDGKIKSHIETKKKVNAKTGEDEIVAVETEVKKKDEKKDK